MFTTFRVWCIRVAGVLLLAGAPTGAFAQTPGDIANQIATITIEVVTLDKIPWAVGATASASLDRGTADTSALRGTLFGVREKRRVTYGTYMTAARQTSNGRLDNEVLGANAAVAYSLSPRWRVLGIQQFNRAPQSLLEWQTVTAGLLVFETELPSGFQAGVYGGMGVTWQELTIDLPTEDRNFPTVQLGAVARHALKGGTGFTATASWAAQANRFSNNVLSGQIAIDSRLVGPLGWSGQYSVSRDHEPVAGRDGVNHSLSVALRLTVAGK